MCIYYNLTLKKICVKLTKMKFKNTSSAITSGNLSLIFNCNEITTILKETSLSDWDLFAVCNTETILDRIFNYRTPITSFDFSRKGTFCDLEECNFGHSMNLGFRKCCETVLGDGSDSDHFHVCMASYALLKNMDGSNQNHVTCYGIDATYKIFKEKFNLVAYGRTDSSRKI